MTEAEMLDSYLSGEFFPDYRQGKAEAVYVVEKKHSDNRFLAALYGAVPIINVSRDVFRERLVACFGSQLCRQAVFALSDSAPRFSARTVLTAPQAVFLSFFAILTVCASVLWPAIVLRDVICLASGGFFIGACTRFLLVALGCRGACRLVQSHRMDPCQNESCAKPLPIYTVLVPLYREATVLPQLAQALRRLDYPQDRLDIKFVVEADDEETRDMAQALSKEGPFETIVVPPCLPRTKPKACNYALRFALGDYLVIYDAEDRPDADQLTKAAAAFASMPPKVACLQARLKIDNAEDSLLSALFALDYDIWFTALLPGLDRLRAPMPLGGTSNHFRIDALRHVGAWDPFNVTEDADLGIRLAQFGYSVSMLDSDTYEEAPTRFSPWLKQRTRWLKGYMQTLLVHLRDPLGLGGRIGLRGMCALTMFLGGAVFSALINPVLWFFFLWSAFASSLGIHCDSVEIFAVVSGSGLFLANALLAGQILLSGRWRKNGYAGFCAFGIVVFWLMVSVAAWRAVLQLCIRPHFWEKTPHGPCRRTSCKA